MPDLILASASKARQTLLHQAGVKFRTQVSQLDEASFKASLKAEDATAQMAAEALGELKADIWFDKPVDLEHARAHLAALSGKTHFLHTSVSVLRGEQVLWHHNETCEMTMRDLSADFIDAYLAQEGEEVLYSVGAYRLEGLGAQLFSKIYGDFFTILGLPLLPLLEFLRNNQILKR